MWITQCSVNSVPVQYAMCIVPLKVYECSVKCAVYSVEYASAVFGQIATHSNLLLLLVNYMANFRDTRLD